jgi:hypothetical protein
MGLKNKLAIYGSFLAKEEEKAEKAEEGKHIAVPEEWETFGLKPYYLDGQYCLIREVRRPLSERRGLYTYNDYFRAVEAWQNSPVSHPLSSKGYRPEDLFFFDTETTGLGSGTGNMIFLLGYASICGNEVVIRQHFLPEPGFEVPLYDSFLRNVDYTTLVTYNGKAFDWPQVQTRHTLVREHVPKLPAFGHFDLLHAARRLWKSRLESVSLSRVEREILSIQRNGDIPGHLAPMIYFDYLETRRMDGIVEVMRHNEEDVCSLIVLYTHLTFQILGLDQCQSGDEKAAVGKWLASLKETEAAIRMLEDSLETLEGRQKWNGVLELAKQYKRKKDYDRALSLFEEVAGHSAGLTKIKSAIEAAKLLEHQFKNPESALSWCQQAASEWEKMGKIVTLPLKNYQKDLKKRLERLRKKISL